MGLEELSEVFGESQLKAHVVNLEDDRRAALLVVMSKQNRDALKEDGKEKRSFEVGDLVLIRNFVADSAVGKKMLPKWTGPFEIVKVLYHQPSCVVKELGSVSEKGRYSVNTMRLWIPRDERLQWKVGMKYR